MPPRALRFLVQAFSDGQAILKAGDETIRVPRSQLPENAKVGDLLGAEFYFAHDEKKRQENLARTLLEEILGQQK